MGLEVSQEFSYVAIPVVAAFMTHMWMSTGVVAARKKYGVFYPTMYALESDNKEAKKFNCVQRGHQNFLEIVPFFLAFTLVASLQHPKLVTFFSLIFLGARVLYFLDYSTGDPKKRMRGALCGYACMVMLMGCCISFTVHKIFL